MDYDRKKLKTMWGQFWAAHQVHTTFTCTCIIIVLIVLYMHEVKWVI